MRVRPATALGRTPPRGKQPPPSPGPGPLPDPEPAPAPLPPPVPFPGPAPDPPGPQLAGFRRRADQPAGISRSYAVLTTS